MVINGWLWYFQMKLYEALVSQSVTYSRQWSVCPQFEFGH